MSDFLDFFLHLDDKLFSIINDYGTTTYVILFLIIFVETGLVIWPFLPGDSLLFAAGAFAGAGLLNIALIIVLLFVAAFLGDTVNYFIGKKLGLRILQKKLKSGKQLVKQEYIDKTHEFYEKHGPKTIIIARFVPIVRTFAPFVAGIGEMNYKKFISYNIIGGAIWVTGLSLLGFFFGNLPIVKENFEIVILGIIFVSILPIIIEFIRHRRKKN
jgi:membrane-associated protein